MEYIILQAQINYLSIPLEDISELLHINLNLLNLKLLGLTSFTFQEAYLIHKRYFPDIPLYLLFYQVKCVDR